MNKTLKSIFFNISRSNFYQKLVKRKYKLDCFAYEIKKSFIENNGFFGRERLAIFLKQKYNIVVNPRTLGNYMKRNGLVTKTRRAKRKRELKNTKVKIKDLVKRVFNPNEDNIVASDVSYIDRNFYLSVAISHKTKAIESWELSKINDANLVLKTIDKIKRKKFIFHSDQGTQYSSYDVLKKLKKMNAKSSMSIVGNCLDNREVEYFFSCLKGEYLNHLNINKLSFKEIKKNINWYINWYNRKRIQKRLNWKTPFSASKYLI